MDSAITFRHNVMTVQSVDTFINIRGGFSRGIRDVYFVRVRGEDADFREMIGKIDSRLSSAMAANRLLYIRLKALPKLMDSRESEYYVSAYDNWKQGKPAVLKSRSDNRLFADVLERATLQAIEKFKTTRPGISESIIRNFTVKLWYWTDTLLSDVVKGWSEMSCVKIAADNVVNTQEYLFFYYVTLLGCDVLLINNREDIKPDENISRLSSEIVLGEFGTTEIPEYRKPAAESRERPQVSKPPVRQERQTGSAQPAPSVKENRAGTRTQTPKARKAEEPQASDEAAQTRTAGKTAGAQTRTSGKTAATQTRTAGKTAAAKKGQGTKRSTSSRRKEKSFEDLAQLASSIVMIAVHNGKGKAIATGSGIMIGKKGFILTNSHVVKGGCLFSVRIEDDEYVYVTRDVIKFNPRLDLAVLRIDRTLKPLPVYDGRKKLARGQKVVAIGSPLGLFNSVSDGIISGFRRIDDVNMIQFTAPISQGSSGGAVLNMYGEIIGISTAGIDSGQNINLAVSYEDIRQFTNDFV